MNEPDQKQLSNDRSAILRSIPSVEILAQSLELFDMPQLLVNRIIRKELETIRKDLTESCSGNGQNQPPGRESIEARIQSRLRSTARTRLQSVINGTGVVLHTNLGRSPLSEDVLHQVSDIATGYSNLELNINTGKRGSRGAYAEWLLEAICQSEASAIVNNCAAALVLILKEFTSADKREVIISRGELVQIGGGFRIPDILESSGAILKEVGTTNQTTLEDYQRAIGPATAMILKVHQSNFSMEGFVESPEREALARLARESGVPLVEDLGSGAIVPTDNWPGTQREPMPHEILKSGVDLVCFSGDKLFGGPQAGIIAGTQPLIYRLKHNPFFRCLRCDKMILKALEVTAENYLDHEMASKSGGHNRMESMIHQSVEALSIRAGAILQSLPPAKTAMTLEISKMDSTVGGGTLPNARIPSAGIGIRGGNNSDRTIKPSAIHAFLLHHNIAPIISRIENDSVMIDLRTIDSSDDEKISRILAHLIESQNIQ